VLDVLRRGLHWPTRGAGARRYDESGPSIVHRKCF